MAAIRPTKSGKFELCIANALLPKRLFFTFDSREAAENYGQEAEKWLAAGVVPAALAEVSASRTAVTETLAQLILRWRNAGRLSRTDDAILGWMDKDPKVSSCSLSDLTYQWAEAWVLDMKLVRVLAPSSIRQRVQALSRALDWHLRSNPSARMINPLRILPRGYSTYSESEGKILDARGQESRKDVVRDRRLLPGEADKIRAVLNGTSKPADKERGIPLPEGDAMLVLFETILHTGLRLREAYTIRKENVNMLARVIRVQTTKQRNGNVVYRDVPMRPELYSILRGYMTPGPGLLFPFWDGTEEGLRITSNRLSHRFASVFRHAPCDSLTEHDLRHEATCQWYELRDEAGQWMFRTEEVNKIMGWSATSVMGARYASFRAESLAERLWAKARAASPDSFSPDR
jgi:integrase